MAVALAAINGYLDQILGINDPALRDALNIHGIDSFDSLRNFSDQDVKDIAEIVRRPGGRIANPAHNPANPVAGVPAEINNPGVRLGFGHIKHLRQLVYLAKFYHKVQRNFNAPAASIPRLTSLWRFKEAIDEEDIDIDVPSKMTTVDNARQVVENIDDYLSSKRGVEDAPLAYIVREIVALPDPANDPGFDAMSYDDQLIRRSRHSGNAYHVDNHAVWSLLYRVFHDSPGWNWISAHSRTRDGRAAYLSMKTHYLGESYQDRLRSNAEAVIERSFYDGTSRNFTLEKLFERLNSAFVDLAAAGEPVEETRKIRILLRSIENAGHLRAARANLVGDPTLRDTFERAINYLSQFASDTTNLRLATGRQPRQAAAIESGGRNAGRGRGRGRGGRGRGGRGGRDGGNNGGRGRGRGRGGGRGRGMEVTDRYYTDEEWGQLTAEQRDDVRRRREERDRRRGVAVIRNVESEERNVRQRRDEDSSTINSGSDHNASVRAGTFMSQRPARASDKE